MKKPKKKKKQRKQKAPKPRRRKEARRKGGRRIRGLGFNAPTEDVVSVVEPLLDAVRIPDHVSRSHVVEALARQGYLSTGNPAVLTTGVFLYSQACEFGQFVLDRFPKAGEVFRTPPWWFLPPADADILLEDVEALLREDPLFRHLRPRWETRAALLERHEEIRRQVGESADEPLDEEERRLTEALLGLEGPDFLERALDLVAMAALIRADGGNWDPAILELYADLQQMQEGEPSPLALILVSLLLEDMRRLGEKGFFDWLPKVSPGDEWDRDDAMAGMEQLMEQDPKVLREHLASLDPLLVEAMDAAAEGRFPISLSQILSLRAVAALHGAKDGPRRATSEDVVTDQVLREILEVASPKEREVVYAACRGWLQENSGDPRAPMVAAFVASRVDTLLHPVYWRALVEQFLATGTVSVADDEPAVVGPAGFREERREEYVAYLRKSGFEEAADWVAEEDFSWMRAFFEKKKENEAG